MTRWRSSWHRWLKRTYRKLAREQGSPEYIARGWALGVGIGCALPIGTQLVTVIPLAFWLRASKVGAVFGTLHCNPLTIWFLYPFQCWLGNKLIGGRTSYAELTGALEGFVHHGRMSTLFELGGEIILSFFIGGLALAAVLTPLTYWFVDWLVRHYRKLQRAQ